jgi:hypothetical protein
VLASNYTLLRAVVVMVSWFSWPELFLLHLPGSLELFHLSTPTPLPFSYEFSLALPFHTTPHDSTSHLLLLLVAYCKPLFFSRRLGPPITPQQRGRSYFIFSKSRTKAKSCRLLFLCLAQWCSVFWSFFLTFEHNSKSEKRF